MPKPRTMTSDVHAIARITWLMHKDSIEAVKVIINIPGFAAIDFDAHEWSQFMAMNSKLEYLSF